VEFALFHISWVMLLLINILYNVNVQFHFPVDTLDKSHKFTHLLYVPACGSAARGLFGF